MPLWCYECRGKTIRVFRLLPLDEYAPREVTFVPARLKGATQPLLRPMIQHFANLSRLQPRHATKAELQAVFGKSFFNFGEVSKGRSVVNRWILLAWIEGVITTYQAGCWGSNGLLQLPTFALFWHSCQKLKTFTRETIREIAIRAKTLPTPEWVQVAGRWISVEGDDEL